MMKFKYPCFLNERPGKGWKTLPILHQRRHSLSYSNNEFVITYTNRQHKLNSLSLSTEENSVLVNKLDDIYVYIIYILYVK